MMMSAAERTARAPPSTEAVACASSDTLEIVVMIVAAQLRSLQRWQSENIAQSARRCAAPGTEAAQPTAEDHANVMLGGVMLAAPCVGCAL